MEVNQQIAAAAKSCFDFNSNINTVHVTGDCKCFVSCNDAVSHARTLNDKTIDVFHRVDEEAVIDEGATDDLTDEAETIPDHLLASVKFQTGTLDRDFEKIPKPAPIEPVITQTPVIAIASDFAAITAESPTTAEIPATNGSIIEKLNHLVDEAEHALGLDGQPKSE